MTELTTLAINFAEYKNKSDKIKVVPPAEFVTFFVCLFSVLNCVRGIFLDEIVLLISQANDTHIIEIFWNIHDPNIIV